METTLEAQKLLIDGEWREAAGGRTMDVVNPATEEVAATVASAGQEDVDAAVDAARRAFTGPWSRLSARERGRLLWKVSERLMEQADEVGRLETLHNGKPIFESRQIDIPAAAECFEYYAGWADKVQGETVPVKGNYAPNVFVSALCVRGRVPGTKPTALFDPGKPAYRLGISEIRVGRKSHELKVKVTADSDSYKVRGTAKIRIKVARALPSGNFCPTDWITSCSSFSLQVKARFSFPAGMARSNAAYPIECLGRHSFNRLYSSIDKMKK